MISLSGLLLSGLLLKVDMIALIPICVLIFVYKLSMSIVNKYD